MPVVGVGLGAIERVSPGAPVDDGPVRAGHGGCGRVPPTIDPVIVGEVMSNADGSFRVQLPAGLYTVLVDNPARGGLDCTSSQDGVLCPLLVRADGVTRVELIVDNAVH